MSPTRLALLKEAAKAPDGKVSVEGAARCRMAAQMAQDWLGLWTPPRGRDCNGVFQINDAGRTALQEETDDGSR